MTTTCFVRHSLALAAFFALPLAQAATIDQASYQTGKTQIGADYKAEKKACSSLSANAKDICVQEAKAKEKVTRAELDANYSGKEKDLNRLQVVKAESAYAVAKERCDDQTGNAKDVCVKAAKAAEVKALADVKAVKQVSEAKTDAAQTKVDADYKVAAEKCDPMAGEAKSSCMASAKSRFGKT